jgi:hypothetical protein
MPSGLPPNPQDKSGAWCLRQCSRLGNFGSDPFAMLAPSQGTVRGAASWTARRLALIAISPRASRPSCRTLPANSNATAGLPLSAPRRRPCVEHPQRRGAGSQPSPQRTRRTRDRISVPLGRSLARAFRAERSWITPHCSPNSDQLASVSRYFCGAAARLRRGGTCYRPARLVSGHIPVGDWA